MVPKKRLPIVMELTIFIMIAVIGISYAISLINENHIVDDEFQIGTADSIVTDHTIVFAGSSHSQCAFYPVLYEQYHVAIIAGSSNSFITMKKKLEAILSKENNVTKVFLEIDPVQFGDYLIKSSTEVSEDMPKMNRSIQHKEWGIFTTIRTIDLRLNERAEQLPLQMRLLLSKGATNRFVGDIAANNTIKENTIDKADADATIRTIYYNESVRLFKEIVALLEQHNVTPIFVVYPQSPAQTQYLLMHGINNSEHLKHVCDIANITPCRTVGPITDFPNELFADATHVNKKGSVRFSRYLIRNMSETLRNATIQP